ncbi:MAG: exosortase/archaeosortase family protein [Planctomycetes bacterium]|nr:exosortase/archaeosortase family protein [Planctomycetota bacterium]
MNQNAPQDTLHDESLARKRWDAICAAIMLLPLALMAFQGDLVQSIAERRDRGGVYSDIRKLSVELQAVEKELKDNSTTSRRAIYLQDRKSSLELEIANLREPIERDAAAWNFSVVHRWPLVLLLGPLTLAALWYRLGAAERRRLYESALATGARNRGLLVALAATALFWLGAWRYSVLDQQIIAHQGDAVLWHPSLGLRLAAALPTYLSLTFWSAAFVYAYADRDGLRRVWLPAAVFVGLMILNFGSESGSWVDLWDRHAQWGYGYFIGPIAAMIFYFVLLERAGLVKMPSRQEGAQADLVGAVSVGLGGLGGAVVGREATGSHNESMLLTPATILDVRPSKQFPPGRLLMTWGIVGIALGLLGLVGARYIDKIVHSPELKEPLSAILKFSYVPLVLGIASLALSFWQRTASDRRGDLAIRLVGLVMIVMAVVWRLHAGSFHYIADATIIPSVLGAALALGGWRLVRVAWVAILFLSLAIPWPERYYVALASKPQLYAAKMAEKFMYLCGYDIWRRGNRLIMDAATGEGLTVAEECSGLKILFAFVALSVVYAFLSPRPAWRRVVIFLSSVPIAVFCNFTRVALMALVYKWGFKEIAHGMTHEMAGFAMLPLAFLLLWAEMRVLDGIERVADWMAADPSRQAKLAEQNEQEGTNS